MAGVIPAGPDLRVAVASGKGGTGKTTVATNLAVIAARRGMGVAYVDCDVEEPNGHLFLKPNITQSLAATILVPEVDEKRCCACGQCSDICQFSAIVLLGKKVVVYPELCHACGGCARICPSWAIREVPRVIGTVASGAAGPVDFTQGLLNVGEAMSPPLIRQVKSAAPRTALTLFDAPPGTSCPVVETIHDTDFVLLVTEPTPFGLHDLKLAVEMVRALEKPFGVVINRAEVGRDQTEQYCHAEGIEILAEIPDDRAVAEAYSHGLLACGHSRAYARIIESLLSRVLERVETGRRPVAQREIS